MVAPSSFSTSARLDPTNVSRFAQLIAATGTKGLLLVARAYLGPYATFAARSAGEGPIVAGLTPADQRLLALAISKLAWEAGELAIHNPDLESGGTFPAWKIDDSGQPPPLSLAHVLAITRAWSKPAPAQSIARTTAAPRETARTVRLAARSTYYTAERPTAAIQPIRPVRTLETRPMATPNPLVPARSRSGCGCGGGGGSYTPPPAAPPVDPCRGGIPPVAPSREPSCGCGCGGCHSCKPPTRTYDSAACPTLAISCETKTALRDCLKVALCDFVKCVTDVVCPTGKFDSNVFNNAATSQQLVDCVGQLACSFLHCLPDALCPPPCEPESPPPPAAVECLPCDYAVEVLR